MKIRTFNQEESVGCNSDVTCPQRIIVMPGVVLPYEYSGERRTMQIQPQKPRRYHLHTEMRRATASDAGRSAAIAHCVPPEIGP